MSVKDNVRYPDNASLFEEINSNFEQQFDKVSQAIIGKIVSLNQGLHRELGELPKKFEMHKEHAQKVIEGEINCLSKLLEEQQAKHTENLKNLKLLQDNIDHQHKVLFSLFIGFIVAILSLCLYNVPMAITIPIISLNLYYLSTILL